MSLAFINAPEHFLGLLGPLPQGARIRARPRSPVSLIVYFTRSRRDLALRLRRLRSVLEPSGALWIAWPKRASGVSTDLTENVVRELGLAHRLVDNKVCAIDEVWSALRLVIRLEDRGPSRGA
ncbi:MAG TPA: DUF3052 domain-containing protein [Solirubrobacteraceae bacterium]|nr:DUF3052 domain-containing protein [Solirubrobacteraceae bacterium]